jgi:hypothetical protein
LALRRSRVTVGGIEWFRRLFKGPDEQLPRSLDEKEIKTNRGDAAAAGAPADDSGGSDAKGPGSGLALPHSVT